MSVSTRPSFHRLAEDAVSRVKVGELLRCTRPVIRDFEVQDARYRKLAGELVPAGFVPTTTTLTKPIVIWQTQPHPQLNIFLEWEIIDDGSFVRVNIADVAAGTQNRAFVFYYLWSNPSAGYAVVNVSTSLILNGVCDLGANTGFFSGDHTHLDSSAQLMLWRNGGWGTDPATGVSLDQSYYPGYAQTLYSPIVSLDAQGGGLFGDPGSAGKTFLQEDFPLSYPQMVVPGYASVMFMVTWLVNTSVSDFEISDWVYGDFGTKDRRVVSPGVTLEVLTPVA